MSYRNRAAVEYFNSGFVNDVGELPAGDSTITIAPQGLGFDSYGEAIAGTRRGYRSISPMSRLDPAMTDQCVASRTQQGWLPFLQVRQRS